MRLGPRRLRHRGENATHTERDNYGRKENNRYREHTGTKKTAHGPRYIDEIQRLCLHGTILRGAVPGRRCMDLYGGSICFCYFLLLFRTELCVSGYGYEFRQVLHESLQSREEYT